MHVPPVHGTTAQGTHPANGMGHRSDECSLTQTVLGSAAVRYSWLSGHLSWPTASTSSSRGNGSSFGAIIAQDFSRLRIFHDYPESAAHHSTIREDAHAMVALGQPDTVGPYALQWLELVS